MKRGVLLLITATILWGGNYISGRFLADAIPPNLLNTIRWAISTLLLWGLLFLRKKKFPIIAKWKEFLILGFFGVFVFSTLTYYGLHSLNASVAGMISAAIPVFILLFTPFILKEKISRRAWIGTIISVVGVIVLFQGKQDNLTHSSLFGEFIILLSCLAWGIYTVLGKKYGKKSDPLTLTAGAAFYGTILSAISCIGSVNLDQVHLGVSEWTAILYVSTFASVVAYLSWNAGVKLLGAQTAAPFINLLPVWAVVFGVVLLHEKLVLLTFIGGVITLLGAFLASYQPIPKEQRQDSNVSINT